MVSVSKERNDVLFQSASAIFLGVAGMFMYTGYDLQCFVVEPVLHSVHIRAPERIGPYDGYYGMAVTNIACLISNLLAPSYLNYISARRLIAVGSVLFSLYFFSFVHLERTLFFAGCVAVGVAFSTYNAGNANYLTEISTTRTIARNQAIFWSVCSTSVFFAGVTFYILHYSNRLSAPAPIIIADTTETTNFRVYSDDEIVIFFGTLTAISVVGIVLHLLLPRGRAAECIYDEQAQTTRTFTQQMKDMALAFRSPRIMLLVPFYMYIGIFFSFWCSVYPTSLQFTKALAADTYLPAYYGMMFCAGNTAMGAATVLASSLRGRSFSLHSLLVFNVAAHFVAFSLILASLPLRSTFTPNDDDTLLFAPRISICLTVAVLFGIGDNANNTLRTVVTAHVLEPRLRTQAFAISRFYHSIAACLMFALSPKLSALHYTVGLTAVCIFSAVLFWMVSEQIKKKNMKEDEQLDDKEAAVQRIPQSALSAGDMMEKKF